MNHRAIAVLVVLSAGLAAGCRAPAAAPSLAEVEELRVLSTSPDTLALPRGDLQRARRAAAALGQDLAGLVFATMQEQGPEAAVRVCSEIAQERTASHGGDGVYVRRISDRLRNPANAPDAAERLQLERMQELEARGELPPEIIRVVRQGEGRHLHLLRAIRVQPGCLACHGEPESIAPEVRRILAERYPDDRAVGYAAGQLRGAISVRVPVEH